MKKMKELSQARQKNKKRGKEWRQENKMGVRDGLTVCSKGECVSEDKGVDSGVHEVCCEHTLSCRTIEDKPVGGKAALRSNL